MAADQAEAACAGCKKLRIQVIRNASRFRTPSPPVSVHTKSVCVCEEKREREGGRDRNLKLGPNVQIIFAKVERE